jgi:hypothetical protein
MRQKRIDPQQRAELAASKPAAAIEGLRPFTVKQGQYLAFIYHRPGTRESPLDQASAHASAVARPELSISE